MTTKEAIEQSIILWKWLLENPTCDKKDYPWPTNEPRFRCYLCEHCQTEHKCPIDWSDYEGSGTHLSVCGSKCENRDSPYVRWRVDKSPLSIKAILKLHQDALSRLERGEIENREDNHILKLEEYE